jgi:hypothetical protein
MDYPTTGYGITTLLLDMGALLIIMSTASQFIAVQIQRLLHQAEH